LNGTFHLSPHENILTIALINIHYLYNINTGLTLIKQARTLIGSCRLREIQLPEKNISRTPTFRAKALRGEAIVTLVGPSLETPKFCLYFSDTVACTSQGKRKIVRVKASFHSGKLFVDWNGQERFSLSCELWIETNEFNTKKNFLVRSNPRIVFLSGN
jgi:hypothetical protein